MTKTKNKILITGTLGFIGNSLLNKLGIALTIENDTYLNSPSWKAELLEGLNKTKPNVIFHVGACSDTLETDVNYMMIRNFEATKVLVDWAVANKAILIYSSSAASYGENGQHPSNLYGWSKYAAETYVISNGGVALRYFNVYGPGEGHKGKMASVAYQMFCKHKNKEKIKLFPGKPKRDFIYIDDVVFANLYALENYKALKGKYYDVGTGRPEEFETVLNILEIPFTYTSKSKIPVGYQTYTCADKDKMMPGWKPKHNIKKGLTKYKQYLCKTI